MSYTVVTQKKITTSMAQAAGKALAHGYALAAWQLPGSGQRKLLVCQNPGPFSPGDILETMGSGFVVQPFDRTRSGRFLKADMLFSFRDNELLPPQTPAQSTAHTWLKSTGMPTSETPFHQGRLPEEKETDYQTNFYLLVEKAIHSIQQQKFEKVVPSRYKTVRLTHDQNPVELFDKMCRVFPQAFVSLVSLPEFGTWAGASPEVLVSVNNQSVFRTVALAGTKPFHAGLQIKDVAWTQKEIEEQALVSRYIINCFKKIRLREFEEHGPKTVQAGKLLHLKTDFLVDLKTVDYPLLGSVMLNLLHPTSAVCGMPLEPALRFLQQHEGYDRSLYTGFIGPVNIDEQTDIYVNLRCIQWSPNRLAGYAGCGVTADSVPENEWKESEIKINSLLNEII
ncbi:MAG: hypothetical protein KatS3mg032_0584 [Cyclobacteriaceae bacterium]|nr:MAG: hypothetical protein KatS3mg032_0584 [Cyclobacteriaceae bacterium]